MHTLSRRSGRRPGALAGLLLLPLAAGAAERTFLWTLESETPEVVAPGADATPYNYPVQPTLRTNTQARSGGWSLDLSGQPWRQATFDNPTTNHVWASPARGAIVLHWMHTGGLDGHMLMQLTGKCRDKRLDTNDGLSLRFRGNTELMFGYAWSNALHGTRVRYSHGRPFATNRWYRVAAAWDTAHAPHLTLQVDDAPPVTGGPRPGATACLAWHHLLWGNDLRFAPPGLYLDDLEVWNGPPGAP